MLDRLLSRFRPTDPAAAETPEELEARLAEDRAARIKFHRDEVRNGPVKWKTLSAGRVASRNRRAETGRQRKMNRRHRATWLDKRLETAVLRGRLQAVGALPYEHGGHAAPHAHRDALVALIAEYGERDPETGQTLIHDDTVKIAVGAALDDYAERIAA